MRRLFILAAAAMLLPRAGLAGEHFYGPYPALYTRECASCHVAYPPQLLSAPGWRQLMQTLERHFGSDASLDTPTRDAVAAFLASRASPRAKHAPTEAAPRITTTAWFTREHRKAESRTALAECGACHTGADRGDFGERGLRQAGAARKREGH